MSDVRDDRPAVWAAVDSNRLPWLALLLILLVSSPAAAQRRASPDDPEIQQAVERAKTYLKNHLRSNPRQAGQSSLAALALLKAGETRDTPEVAAALRHIVETKFKDGSYRPQHMEQHIYESGVDIMTLANADPDYYHEHMKAIAAYIISRQHSEGYWEYPQPKAMGDTSISQYGMLGLWTAAKHGIEVPVQVWDRAAQWHISRQNRDGGFTYQPRGMGGGSSTHSMTAAGTGSLGIARLHLYPDREEEAPASAKRSSLPDVLQQADGRGKARTTATGPRPKPRTPAGPLDRAIDGGLAWLTERYTVDKPTTWPMYYLYGLERAAALTERAEIAGRDWYTEGAAHLVRSQTDSGTWSCTSGAGPATAFGILFLIQSTAQDLGGSFTPAPVIGSGLLAGGRGLPENLRDVEMKDGKVQTRKLAGEVDDLLASLESPELVSIEAAQTALIETVQLGDREALIGQKDRLKKLARDPRVEVRRTALWALGRSEDLRIAPLLIEALSDPDLDVAIEARNALCTLSRKPDGFGLPPDPRTGLRENASDQQKQAAAETWKSEAQRNWRNWYRSIRPYEERDDLTGG